MSPIKWELHKLSLQKKKWELHLNVSDEYLQTRLVSSLTMPAGIIVGLIKEDLKMKTKSQYLNELLYFWNKNDFGCRKK